MQIPETITSTFRGRTISFAHASGKPKTVQQGRAHNRWLVYKQLCIAKSEFGLNDRCLAVLSSLLSFMPEDEISEKKSLVVFPSNRQLSLRAHGMPESTLRRHLVSLIAAGIIERKDSPTGKRYAHKAKDGSVEVAFGFSFAPLISRVQEIAQAAERILDAQKTQKRLRDEISVLRREISATFADVASEGRPEAMEALFIHFRSIVDAIPRRATSNELKAIKVDLDSLRDEMDILLKNDNNGEEMSASVAQNERHHNESLPESLLESKNIQKNDLKSFPAERDRAKSNRLPQLSSEAIPLDLVLRACPNIRDYTTGNITSWRDLIDASQLVSRFLGITQSAYVEARQTMGIEGVSAVIAWILQRSEKIQSAGGYLRSLTQQARAGGFSIGNILITGLKDNIIQAR